MMRTRTAAASILTVLSTVSLGAGAKASPPETTDQRSSNATRVFHAEPTSLNNSGSTGEAMLRLKGTEFTIRIKADGLAPNLPRAQHIHGIGTHECPSADFMPSMHTRADGTGQHFLSTVDGLPLYGPIAASLTTEGDTSPAAGLSLESMPVADAQGQIRYTRTFTIPSAIAEQITRFVIVEHGVDFNNSGDYDFDAAGASELNAAAPQEPTAPANCGPIVDRGYDHRS